MEMLIRKFCVKNLLEKRDLMREEEEREREREERREIQDGDVGTDEVLSRCSESESESERESIA